MDVHDRITESTPAFFRTAGDLVVSQPNIALWHRLYEYDHVDHVIDFTARFA